MQAGTPHLKQLMEAGVSKISVDSQRQAMDWSLVLISQGIEATIEQSNDGTGPAWSLVVSVNCYDQAVEALRLYHQENRRWPWRHELFEPGVLFDWAGFACVLLFCFFYAVASSRPGFEEAGIMSSSGVSQGQWWRLFTAVWLHADLGHLASNAMFGLVFFGFALGR
ncbi:MAG TPA: rhomboid family intramembrane serine protease, partial [Clostridia bacterium]|nr:rhomboid family intramembrane serine protease [Clostridia bacterium]